MHDGRNDQMKGKHSPTLRDMGEPVTEILKGLRSQVGWYAVLGVPSKWEKCPLASTLYAIASRLTISVSLHRKLVRRDENQKSSHNVPSQAERDQRWWQLTSGNQTSKELKAPEFKATMDTQYIFIR